MNYQELTQKAHSNAVNHGFWDAKPSNEHCLMLIITEIAEMVEADRKGDTSGDCRKIFNDDLALGEKYNDVFKSYVKDTVEDEFADVVIRLFDLAGELGIQWNKMQPCKYFRDFTKSDFCENAFGLAKGLSKGQISIEKRIQFGVEYVVAWAKTLKINLDWFVDMKMKYNESREMLHGKKY